MIWELYYCASGRTIPEMTVRQETIETEQPVAHSLKRPMGSKANRGHSRVFIESMMPIFILFRQSKIFF